LLDRLKEESGSIGKPSWRPLLRYAAGLHERSTHPPRHPFPHDWEEIGPGYCYGPAFGHWDIVHQVLDVLPCELEHARAQILNNLAAQQPDGLVPGSIWMREETPRFSTTGGHPPVWPAAVDDLFELTGDRALLAVCLDALEHQIGWFEGSRKADGEGFYYTDIVTRQWESGVDEGVRFDDAPKGPFACVDATSHVFAMYDCAARWSAALQKDSAPSRKRADGIGDFLRDALFDAETGFFHDSWAVGRPERRHLVFEGMWPVVAGAASPEQAGRVVRENLLSEERFLAPHPMATVALSDPAFELRLWRGPSWNSMTLWAARGCLRYGFRDEARVLVERALDSSAEQFRRTGTIWEFYHPLGGSPEDVQRKPHTHFNAPCRDYLGHNPLIAMARMWSALDA